MTIKRVFNDIRQKHEGKLSCEHLVNLQDVRNLKLKYNFKGRHSNDLKSTCGSMGQLQGNEIFDHKLTLAVKLQGLEQEDNMDDLWNEYFIFCVQTHFQRVMLKKFCNNIICIHLTHGTNL